jgi:endogenous inhibitor of DNA gyrase (YacG/DUF329 family)
MKQTSGEKTVKCPVCATPVVWSRKQRWKPFCSERCKLIDLGAWFDESNRIPDSGFTDSNPEDN